MSKQGYSVGQLVSIINRDIEELTPGCQGNVLSYPQHWRTFLRHVIPRAMNHPEAREVIAGLEQQAIEGNQASSAYIGFHATNHNRQTGSK